MAISYSKLFIIFSRLHKNAKAASEVDYPAYGVTGPAKERVGPGPGDRKLAQSAQMYHYQHQKQQMIAMEKCVLETKINILDVYCEHIIFGLYNILRKLIFQEVRVDLS